MYSDIGRWMGAISDVHQADKMAKKPPLLKKLVFSKSVEEEAIDAFAAKKKAEAMEAELKQWIILTHGLSAWDELIRMQGKIRKQRQDQIYAQQERQKAIINGVAISVLIVLCVALVSWIGYIIITEGNWRSW